MCRINLWTYYVCVSSQRHLVYIIYIHHTVLKTKLRRLTTSPCQIQITITRQYPNPQVPKRKSDISNTSNCQQKWKHPLHHIVTILVWWFINIWLRGYEYIWCSIYVFYYTTIIERPLMTNKLILELYSFLGISYIAQNYRSIKKDKSNRNV